VYLLAPPATRAVSRHTGLPVPIVAAVNNELRSRGVLTRERPARLTAWGMALVERLGMTTSLDATCECCQGLGITVLGQFTQAVDRLREVMAGAPAVDLALDQSFCTAETKVRRVLFMMRAGVLPGESLLLVGDDDLVSLAIGMVGTILGQPLIRRLAVVDVSPAVLQFIEDQSAAVGLTTELVPHDVREPLPTALRGRFGAAMTDPPYTADGARLFLSRAVEGLADGPGRPIFFSFGPKGPDDALAVQRSIADLGLATIAMVRNFNEYSGAGILGGISHLQHLVTTCTTKPVVEGVYQGETLYTADLRDAARAYRCLSCKEQVLVRPGTRWGSVGQLESEGCPRCGQRRFRPLQLIPVEKR